MRFRPLAAATFLASCLLATAPLAAAPRAQLVASGFAGITAVVPDPVLRDTVYVVQIGGVVRTLQNGTLQPAPFLDLSGVVFPEGGERGLLGMAFPKDAASSGRVFVNFVDQAGHTRIARFTRSAGNLRVANPASRKDLMWPVVGGGRQGFIEQPGVSHKGGHLAFGPDGYLYIALGDGGGDRVGGPDGNDPNNNAQNPQSLLGKMLRVNVSVPDSDPIGYAIPPGNPAFPVANAWPEIWAFGLRNPWRYSFDDFGANATEGLFIGDVGQSAREEIDFEPRGRSGRNYGWRVYEGSQRTPGIDPSEQPAFGPVTPPLYEYPRNDGWSVTGGYVYRGLVHPSLYGRYVYGDCIMGRVWSLGLNVNAVTGEAAAAGVVDHTAELGGPFKCITTFARDAAGELYFADLDFANNGASRIFRIADGASLPPATPTGVAATVTGSTVAITWTSSAGGGAISSYLLDVGSTPGATDLGSFPLTAPGLTVAGVPNGRYFVRVRAFGPGGVSPPSSDVEIVVGCTAAPPAPTGVSATAAGGQVVVTWTLPAGATGTLLEAGLTSGAVNAVVPIAAPTQSFSSPVPAGTYFLRLRAVNACGTGAASPEQTVTVP